MNPTFVQRAFADHWPLKLLLYSGPIGTTLWVWIKLSPRVDPNIWSILNFVGITFCAATMGGIVAFLLAPILLSPLYRWQGRRNGAPYRIGDQVRILCRKHHNEIGLVNAVWDEQLQVRVQLADQPPQEKDLFSYVQVERMNRRQSHENVSR